LVPSGFWGCLVLSFHEVDEAVSAVINPLNLPTFVARKEDTVFLLNVGIENNALFGREIEVYLISCLFVVIFHELYLPPRTRKEDQVILDFWN